MVKIHTKKKKKEKERTKAVGIKMMQKEHDLQI